LEKWPIYYRETVAASPGIDSKDFGVIRRDDGQKQTTFRGYPLYYFFGDKAAGDTAGQKVKDVWFVIDPSNFPSN
jgi:predicted lipoprotein with Yx(FWY)xxD motif